MNNNIVNEVEFADGANKLYESNKFREAFNRYILLAENGNESAIVRVCHMLIWGEGVGTNLEKAEKWAKIIEKTGNLESSFYLGKIAEIRNKWDEAIEYYIIGQSKKHLPSIVALAYIYKKGNYKSKYKVKAYELFIAAYKLGHLYAKGEVAKIYLRGEMGLKFIPRGLFMLIKLPFDIFYEISNNPNSINLRK